MKYRPWYKHYPAEFLNGVEGLGPAVIGCYIVVLDMIYDHGGPIKNDPRVIGGRMGCSIRLARSLVDKLLAVGKLFHTPHRELTNMRAEVEINLSVHNARKWAELGAKGGRKRVENARKLLLINEIGQGGLKHTRVLETREDKKEGLPEEAKAPSPAEPIPISSTLKTNRLARAS